MADWYVARGGQQRGPMSADEVRAVIARREIGAADPIWTEGMAQWLPAADVPQFTQDCKDAAASVAAARAPAAVPYARPFGDAPLPVLTDRGLQMLRGTAPWVRLLGVLIWVGAGFAVLGGVITVLSAMAGFAGGGTGTAMGASTALLLMGAVYVGIAALYFFPGLYLNRYASRINDLARNHREDMLEQALAAQKAFWKFMGILLLASFAVWVVMILAFIGLGVAASNARSQPVVTPTVLPAPPGPYVPRPTTP